MQIKLFNDTFAGVIKKYVKNPIGNAAREEVIAQLAKMFNELNGEINNEDYQPILDAIKIGLECDPLFEKFKDHIVNEFHNYYYQNWTTRIRSIVALSVIEQLAHFSDLIKIDEDGLYISDDIHPDQIITTVFQISQTIKTAISDKMQDPFLVDAINAINPKEVCERLGNGANASEYIHMAIVDPKKTCLLIYLLHAGVNPSDVYHIEGISDVFDTSLNSVGKFFGTPVALGKKIAIEVMKRGLNLISLTAYYENVEAMEILLAANHGIYYPKQLEDALQDQIEILGKYNHGNALTVALMNPTSEKSQNIAMQLLRAGASLNVVKGGTGLDYGDYNNLQLIVKFKLPALLLEALNVEIKSKTYQHTLFEAMNYQAANSTNDCNKTTRELIETEMPEMLKSYDAVYALLANQETKYDVDQIAHSNEPILETQENAKESIADKIAHLGMWVAGLTNTDEDDTSQRKSPFP
ncbi:MAG: hypothetical protein M3R00_03825 [Pseudomonadota bacterium]|nr:hypothetical protein [Pseudomonadota bacterium]